MIFTSWGFTESQVVLHWVMLLAHDKELGNTDAPGPVAAIRHVLWWFLVDRVSLRSVGNGSVVQVSNL